MGMAEVWKVMSGAGWLAKALREKNVDVIATDDHSWTEEKKWEILTRIEKIDCVEAIKKYGKVVDVLIISWPWMDEQAYLCIKKMYEVNPECIVVYIGEGDGGCTASETFFAAFAEIEGDELFKEVAANFYGWWGIHDHPMIGKYEPISDEMMEEMETRDRHLNS